MRWIAIVLIFWAGSAAGVELSYVHEDKRIAFVVPDGIALERSFESRNEANVFGQMGFHVVAAKQAAKLLPVYFPTTGGYGVLTHRVLVGGSAAVALAIDSQASFSRQLTPKIVEVALPSAEHAVSYANLLALSGDVTFAHPVFHFPVEARQSYDPLVVEQWHLRNTGQRGGTVGSDIRALQAWEVSRGSSDTVVALIDLGFEQDHPDLVGIWYENPGETPGNRIDDDGNGLVDDVRGWNYDIDSNNLLYGSSNSHGTATAGLIASRENGIGITGVCPECRVLPLVIYTDVADAIAAFQYAYEHGAKVVSNSWGYRVGTPATEALESTLTELGQEMSILFAMPNYNGNPCRELNPDISAVEGVLAVSAADFNDGKVVDAGYGPCLKFVGPSSGSQINATVTTDRVGERGYNRSDMSYPTLDDRSYTQSFYGTSAATPIVAGVFALVHSLYPTWTPAEVLAHIQMTADKISPSVADYDDDGHSIQFGFGRPNAYRALTE